MSGSERSVMVPTQVRGGTFIGLLLGIALGTLVVLLAAWYVTRHSPFRDRPAAPPSPAEIPKEILEMVRGRPPEAAAEKPPAGAPGATASVPSPSSSLAALQREAPPPSEPPAGPTKPAPPPGSLAATAPPPAAPPASPTAAAPQPSAATVQPTPAPPADAARWFWQVGAFGTEQEANRVRAELALLGLTSQVEPARMSDGRTLYRVRVGPYPSQQAAQAARARLQSAGYQPVMVRG